MNFKNNGFALVEAMFAVVMIGMMLGPIFLLENTVVEQVMKITERYRYYISAHNAVYEARKNQPITAQEFTFEKKIENPAATITYQLKAISTESPLHLYKHLLKEEITIVPLEKGATKEQMVYYFFKPAEKQE